MRKPRLRWFWRARVYWWVIGFVLTYKRTPTHEEIIERLLEELV